MTRGTAAEEEEESTSTKEQEKKDSDYFQQTDQEFQAWILEEMTQRAPQLRELYPALFLRVAEAVRKWRQRYRGNRPCWNRLFPPDRVLKEIVEAVPVVDAVLDWMDRHPDDDRVTVMDLCSGKGYLSMLLSELLPAKRVEKCLLIDKAWPLCHAEPQPHHMSWDHIYGLKPDDGSTYFDTWPIPLVTSKQDLKQSRTIQQLQERLLSSESKVIILAVHLCGTLSLQAIKLFQALPNAPMLVLKPCCLPNMSHAHRQDVFQVGEYCFPTREVCAPGKWTGAKRVWDGPPRWQLQPKFETWCHYLQQAMSQDEVQIKTKALQVPIQTKGGFQNTFLVAERVMS